MNDEEGVPHITTCPIEQLYKKGKGYFSKCGAAWWTVQELEILKQKPKLPSTKQLFANNIDFENTPIPKGHEIIELKFKPLEYSIIDNE